MEQYIETTNSLIFHTLSHLQTASFTLEKYCASYALCEIIKAIRTIDLKFNAETGYAGMMSFTGDFEVGVAGTIPLRYTKV